MSKFLYELIIIIVIINSLTGDGGEGGRVVLHESGSERGRFICDVCGSECRSAAGLKSHTTAMHQARYHHQSFCLLFPGYCLFAQTYMLMAAAAANKQIDKLPQCLIFCSE